MRLRLAELIAADLGLGLPQEHVLRQCRIALGLAERVSADAAERRSTTSRCSPGTRPRTSWPPPVMPAPAPATVPGPGA
jgi:hypothetical protein